MPDVVIYETEQEADDGAATVSAALDYPSCGLINGRAIGRVAPHGCTGDGKGANFVPGCPHATVRETAPVPTAGGQWALPIDRTMAQSRAVLAALPAVADYEQPMTVNVLSYTSPGSNDIAPAFAQILAAGLRGVIFVPAGNWTLGSPVVIPCDAGLSVVGEGADASILTVTHSGVGITMDAPPNSSTAGHYTLRDMRLVAAPGVAGTACGVVDVGATYPYFCGLTFIGFKVGLELRQSELADVERCDFEMTTPDVPGPTAGVIGLLITDAALTNRISISRCQFNGGGTQTGVADNGGAVHTYSNININGLYTGFRIAGVQTGLIEGVECESTQIPVSFVATDHMGHQGTGQCGNVTVRNSFFACTGSQDAPLRIDSAGRIRFDSSQVAIAQIGIYGVHNSPQILTDGQVYGAGQPFTLFGP